MKGCTWLIRLTNKYFFAASCKQVGELKARETNQTDRNNPKNNAKRHLKTDVGQQVIRACLESAYCFSWEIIFYFVNVQAGYIFGNKRFRILSLEVTQNKACYSVN